MMCPPELSRREFLLFPAIAIAAASLGKATDASYPSASAAFRTGGEAFPSEYALSFEECTECRGHGIITCPACDGTGLWTEASESAGLYQREAARASEHCAWCNEWGEAPCPTCSGTGIVPLPKRTHD